jgi:hypothetical protein
MGHDASVGQAPDQANEGGQAGVSNAEDKSLARHASRRSGSVRVTRRHCHQPDVPARRHRGYSQAQLILAEPSATKVAPRSPLLDGGVGSMTPSERALRARMAAFALHAQRDPRDTTRAARAAFLDRFEDEVDPDRTLSETERLRRAEAAKRAHFTKLALRSAKGRRRTDR